MSSAVAEPEKKQRKRHTRGVVPVRPPMGRPTKMNPEICRVILDALVRGNSRTCAAELAGISYDTFRNWMNRGEAVEHAPNPAEEERIYIDFVVAVQQAEAQAQARHVGHIERAAGGKQWQAAGWWLERRHRKDWGQVVKTEGAVVHEHRHTVDLTQLTDEQLMILRDLKQKAIGQS